MISSAMRSTENKSRNVRSVKKDTKHSSVILLCLVSYFTERTLSIGENSCFYVSHCNHSSPGRLALEKSNSMKNETNLSLFHLKIPYVFHNFLRRAFAFRVFAILEFSPNKSRVWQCTLIDARYPISCS